MISESDVLESLPDGIIGLDSNLTICSFNQAAEVLCEVSRTTAVGRPLTSVFRKDPDFVAHVTATMSSGRLLTDHQQNLSRRFSGPIAVGVTTSRVLDNNGAVVGAVVALKDRSGIKALEGAALRKDRLAYIGTFAANLAHEIKNPLGGLRGAAQLITRKTKDETLTEYAELVIREADRLNTIVTSMLDFARPACRIANKLNIHQLLDSAVELLKGEGVELVRAYDPSLPSVIGDSGSLRQVFLNLIKNGVEACSDSSGNKSTEGATPGRVTIETRIITDFHMTVPVEPVPVEPMEDEENEAANTPPGTRSGTMAAVLIRGTGTGIEDADMEKIFTPFFTTKPRGSGLGMALSLKIVREHHGLIQIDSTPGKGTTVTVYLPTAFGPTTGE
ncbi:MAG: PAS domain-containing protein [Proteobacteria bacterium]|nr:PAS domain-containing protein [Pseudomonadota bacterium]